ncbi:MAG: DUF2752 domain-containing protein [Prevotella sp.]|nr:DUF2752 domain-containing protein [Prevotella sp.]
MRHHTRHYILGILLLLAAVYVYSAFDPSASTWFPKCPFLVLTGLKCPGCGSQRAVHSLLHGDVGGAFAYNAMLVISLPLVAFLIYVECMRKLKPQLYSRVHNPWMPIAVAIIFFAWAVGRNIWNW